MKCFLMYSLTCIANADKSCAIWPYVMYDVTGIKVLRRQGRGFNL